MKWLVHHINNRLRDALGPPSSPWDLNPHTFWWWTVWSVRDKGNVSSGCHCLLSICSRTFCSVSDGDLIPFLPSGLLFPSIPPPPIVALVPGTSLRSAPPLHTSLLVFSHHPSLLLSLRAPCPFMVTLLRLNLLKSTELQFCRI